MSEEKPTPNALIESTRRAFDQNVRNQLSKNVADAVMAKALPAARMSLETASDDEIPVGRSKYGGHPDVPKNFEWPHVSARLGHKAEKPYPLTFALQLNFAEVADMLSADSVWPTDGLLLVFFDSLTAPALNRKADRSGLKLVYVPHGEQLTRTKPPECIPPIPSDKSKTEIAPHSIEFEPVWLAPELMLITKAGSEEWNRYTQQDRRQYGDWWEKHFKQEEESKSFVGGHAVASQEDPISSTTKHALGFFEAQDEKSQAKGERQVAKPLPESDGSWKLLLQFDFDDEQITESFVYENVRFFIFVSEACVKSRSFSAAVWTWDQD